MAHGGARKGAGRRKGSVTRRSQEIVAKATAEGITPLEYMLSILRDEKQEQSARFTAAKEAAPYLHPRLANVEVQADVTITPEEKILEELMNKSRGLPNGNGAPANH